MKPPVETIRIGKLGRDQLIKLRRQTGIENWNILCRWAVCVSLREPTKPAEDSQRLDGGVEMSWKVFAGEYGDVYAALLSYRLTRDGYEESSDGASRFLRAHINRGLSYLSSGFDTKNVMDFADRWLRGEVTSNP